MNGRTLAATAFLVLLLMPAAYPPARASLGPVRVFLVTDSDSALVGGTVNFTAYTFLEGERADLPEPPAVYLVGGAFPEGRPLPVSSTSTGRYDGTYTVLQADLGEESWLTLEVVATYKGLVEGQAPYSDSSSETFYVRRPTAPVPEYESVTGRLVESSAMPIRPGSKLKFLCCATLSGRPVDLPGLLFQLSANSYDQGPPPTLEYERLGTGVYLVRCRVPDVRQDENFYLRYQHNLSGYNSSSSVNDASFSVDFFTVLYHELARKGSRVDFELLVSDHKGAAVNGSSVLLWADPYTGGNIKLELGRTDNNGRVKGFFELGPKLRYLNFFGWANTSRRSQSFSGYMQLEGGPYPRDISDNAFHIVPLGHEGALVPGAWANLSFQAFDYGEPVRNATVEVYVQTETYDANVRSSQTLDGFRARTDGNGTFRLNFTFQPRVYTGVRLTVVGPRLLGDDGGTLGYDNYYIDAYDPETSYPAQPEPSWNLTFSTASPGRASYAYARSPPEGLISGSGSWTFTTNSSESFPPWRVLSGFQVHFLPAKGGELRGNVVIPRQLKPGMNLTMSVGITNSSGGHSHRDVTFRVKAAAAAAPEADVCCLTSIFVFNSLLIGLLLFNYLAARKAPARKNLNDLGVDERIDAVLGAGGTRPAVTLPIRVEQARSEECTACRRMIARGNLAYRCVCGGRFHEHCTGNGAKCPSCGREWTKG